MERAFKHSPFRGLVRFLTSTDHGTIWLAFSNFGTDNPVIQHRPSLAAKTAARKKSWFTRVRRIVSRLFPSGNSCACSMFSEARPCNHRCVTNMNSPERNLTVQVKRDDEFFTRPITTMHIGFRYMQTHLSITTLLKNAVELTASTPRGASLFSSFNRANFASGVRTNRLGFETTGH